MSKETPYSRLKSAALEFQSRVVFPERKSMWFYPRARLHDGWKLDDLFERVKAADQLGYDVRIRAKDDGLHVEYVKRPGELPSWITY